MGSRLRIGIDIDGTITDNPDFFRRFIENQLEAGNEVHIITGGTQGREGDFSSPEHRVRQLRSFGITACTALIQFTRRIKDPYIGISKGEYCLRHDIDLMIDNDPAYLEEIVRISPRTQVLLMIKAVTSDEQ